MDDKIITIAGGSITTPGENYFIIDNTFMTWKEGFKYLRKKMNYTEEQIDAFFLVTKEEIRNHILERKRKKSKESYEDWKKRIINEYKTSIKKS